MASLEGKVIAITGATGGMGLATARLLAARGASLSLADLDSAKLDSLVSSLGSPPRGKLYTTHETDVTSSSQVDAWIHETVSRHGRLDGAANLAGVAHDFTPMSEMTDNEWDRVMRINCNGTMYSMRAQLKAMREMGEGGVIVNTASCAALVGTAEMGAYVTSKHAVIGMTKTAAREVGEEGIRVLALAPGPIDTPMARPVLDKMEAQGNNHFLKKTALNRIGTPEEVAEFLAFLLSDVAKNFTGAVLPIDGGFAA